MQILGSNPRQRALLASLALILLLILACNLPTASNTPDANAVNTAAAQAVQTEFARLTAAAPTITLTATFTQPPEAATATLLPTLPILSPPPLATDTLPAGNPTISASVETNCRLGPGPVYPRVGYLLPGQTSTVVGRNSDNSWWFIENPRKPGTYCWIWGQTTTVTGNIALLPVLTPPPPPTPAAAYQVTFNGFIDCGEPTAIFAVTNTGGLTFKSVYLTIKLKVPDVNLYGPELDNSPFMNSPNSCPVGSRDLAPGETKYLGGEVGFGLGSGDKLRAVIVLCTDYNGGGECLESVLDFTVP